MSLILEIMMSFVWWAIGFPVVWIIVTPVIFVISIFGNGHYWTKLKKHYGTVTEFWKNLGILLVP
jgi:hypothetical protein